jgi:NMD protein affecting ribosome stability and mRNA decay
MTPWKITLRPWLDRCRVCATPERLCDGLCVDCLLAYSLTDSPEEETVEVA